MSPNATSGAIEYLPQPQEVEVYRAQRWVLGLMVGWWQRSDDSCRALVRIVERGTEKTAWAELEHVRLLEYRTPTCPEQWTIQLLVARARADERMRSGSPVTGDPGAERTGRHRAHGEGPDGNADGGAGPLPRRRRTDASHQGLAATQGDDEFTHPITLAAAARRSSDADVSAVAGQA